MAILKQAKSGTPAPELCREYGMSSATFYKWRGKPQQNAYIEQYNRTVRSDGLTQYLVERLDEVQEYATRWLWTYNYERPNMALGGITPMQKLAVAA